MADDSDTVLVPVDGSPQSKEALEYALEHHADADVLAYHAIDPADAAHVAAPGVGVPSESYWGEVADEAESRADEILSEAADIAADHGTEIRTLAEHGRPARAVVERAEDEDAAEIVIGSHGRTGVSRILLGSVAEKVIRRAHCPVTVVR